MENSNISPVTESDMREYFDRIATSFVGLSAQARELVSVRETVNNLSNRIDQLVAETSKLKGDVNEAYELMRMVERERDDAKRQLAETETANNNQMVTIIAQASEIESLRQQLQHVIVERDAERETVSNLQVEAANRTSEINSLSTELDRVRDNRNYWRDQADAIKQDKDKVETFYLEASARLDKIRSDLA